MPSPPLVTDNIINYVQLLYNSVVPSHCSAYVTICLVLNAHEQNNRILDSQRV